MTTDNTGWAERIERGWVWFYLLIPLFLFTILLIALLFFVKTWSGILTGGAMIGIGCFLLPGHYLYPRRSHEGDDTCSSMGSCRPHRRGGALDLDSFLKSEVVSLAALADTLVADSRCVMTMRTALEESSAVALEIDCSEELALFMCDSCEEFRAQLCDELESLLEAGFGEVEGHWKVLPIEIRSDLHTATAVWNVR